MASQQVAPTTLRPGAPGPRSSFITAKDGTQIFYKEWGQGRPVVFSHGRPLNADVWDDQLFFFAQNGFPAIAHDRRGHGRSQQPSHGNDMGTYADDLAAVMDTLRAGGEAHPQCRAPHLSRSGACPSDHRHGSVQR